MSPRTEALAYRIWCFADPRGWDVTVQEIAQECGMSWQSALNVCRHKGWLRRLRVVTTDISRDRNRSTAGAILQLDDAFSGLGVNV